MATKSGSKKGSKKSSGSASAAATAPAAAQADPKKEALFECIQAAFRAQGLTPITSPLNQIVWPSIPRAVKQRIGISMRSCIRTATGNDPGDLSGAILLLSAHEPVMTVATLIDDIDGMLD
jgi:hypothetical protein